MHKRVLVALGLLVAVVCVAGFANAMRPDKAEVRQKNWPAPYEVARTETDSQDADPATDAPQVELPAETEIVRQENGSAYCANRVLLSFDGAMDRDELTSRLEKDGVEVEAIEVVSNALDDNEVLVRVTYRGDQVPADLAEELQKLDYVGTAEPDFVQKLCETSDQLDVTPNDERFPSQWGLTAIGAPTAWDTRKSEGAVTVAVIDSGVAYSHPDLANNLVSPSYAFNVCDDTYGASAVNDTNGHGTHVTGIIAAETGNAIGVSGVSYNARVLPVMVLSSDGETVLSSDVIEAIDYVISCKTSASSEDVLKNIRVINLSLGGYERSTTYANAIKRAHDAGILVACAGGNESTSGAHYPAAYSYAVGVSALKKTSSGVIFDRGYSNYGSYIDLSAPGTSILSTVPDGEYSNMSGTSMATPMVSGAAALVFAGNMDLSPDEVEQILKEKSDDLGSAGWDKYYGAGAIRLDNAVAARHLSQASIEPIPDQPLVDGGVTPALTVTYGSTTLEPDVDYTVAYANNTAVGTATATVTGKGNYVGSRSTTFTVVGKDLSSATIGDIPQQVYTGSELKPTAEVVLDGVSLVEGTDYTLSYRNNVRWGTGTLVVTGMGNYSGTASKDFDIVASAVEIPVPDTPLVYNGEEQFILPESESYTFEGDISGTNAGSYTVKVTPGEGVHWSDGTTESKQITWTIKPAVIDTSTVVNTGLTYNGSPQIGVKSGAGYAITAGRATATAAGTYTATIELLDPANYTWEDGTTDAKTVTWSIIGESYDMSGVTFPDAIFTYDGEEHGIFIQGELPEGVSVSYEGNIEREPGVYEATAHFSGDTATHENPADMTATLTIEKLRVTVPTVSETFVFDGMPKLGPTAPDDALYTLETAPHTDAGVYTATAKLIDPAHYCWDYDEPTSEDQPVRWVISPADVYDIEVEPIGNQFYTGETIEPALTLRLGEAELVEGEDFTVTYADNTELGIAKATIEGKGNYAGVRDLYFSIINEPAEDEVTVTFDSGDGSPVLTQVISRGSVAEKPDDPELAGFYFRGWLLDGEKYDFASPVQEDIVLTAEWLDKLPNYTVSFDSAGGTAVEPQTVTEGECATEPADPTRELYVFDGWLLDGDSYDFTQPVMGDLELVASWKHAPGSVSIADALVTCSGGPYVYDGLAKVPSVSVTLDGKQLAETTDYIVSVIENVNAGTASVVITGTGIYTGTKVATFEIAQKQIDASAKLGGLVAQVYSGFALEPDLSVTVDGRLLKEDVDYTLTYENNVNAGTAGVMVTGKGNYTGTKSATFSIKRANIKDAKIQPIPDQPYTGKGITPPLALTFNGKTLVKGVDYTPGYDFNVDVGTAEVIVDGIGNFTGRIGKSFKIVEKAIAWKRLAGRGRYDTMAAIVEEGWSGQTGGTVVVATGADFKDALAAAGLAGLYDAPVVLTNGKDSKLSPQAARELKALRPSQVFVAGGPAAVSDGVMGSIRSTTGVTPVRLYGKSSASTSAALALQGRGRWGDTAIIATNKSFKDALSAAPLSYAKHWPILLASNGTALNADVLSALRSCGIRKVYIVGGTAAVTPAVEDQLKGAGIKVAGRLAGKSGVQTSRAIADFAIENGLSVKNMAYATSQAFPDALGGAAFCGKNRSVLLLCDDRAQYNLSFATQKKDGIEQGYVFGGTGVFSDGLMARLPK